MKNLWKCASGLCAVMALGLSAANAQTVMNGPYYATPSWDQTLPAATRFVVLSNFNNEAVLDRETGLVWARSPNIFPENWYAASQRCYRITIIGNRKGWRLPSSQELSSLVDPSVASPGLALPPGHPFTNVELGALYWSATKADDDFETAYSVGFNGERNMETAKKGTRLSRAWCVRGGQAIDAQ
jgi:hypothetical protein